MAYDLRTECWLPFHRRSGEVVWGPPSLLTDDLERDPVVALAAPRPDFNGALLEFLIGLMTVALLPEDEQEWRKLWRNPPMPDALRAALDALPPAFDLDGDGPRFLQDHDPGEVCGRDPNPIDALLIDAAGEQTLRNNKDLFVKRDRINALGRPAAAMALITLQTYAPAGGQGNRTSMRGGGPLTTLIEPRTNDSPAGFATESRADQLPLWKKIWANAETVDQWLSRGPDTGELGADATYPWLAKTRISDPERQGRPTTPQDGHPLQAYFGMPRRIHLVFESLTGRCDLTGRQEPVVVTGFHSKNYGVQYTAWHHPLTPYRKNRDGALLPVHGQSDAIAWKDWAGLLFSTPDSGKRPARCVVHFIERRGESAGVKHPRLHVVGYDMDNMKARGWTEAEIPALATADAQRLKLISITSENLTQAADAAAQALIFAVKSAWFARAEDAKGDFRSIRARFWSETESEFYRVMEVLAKSGEAAQQELLRGFCEPLETTALRIFDVLCPAGGMEFAGLRRLVAARHNLRNALKGYGKSGKRLAEALGLSANVSKAGRKKEVVQ